MMAVQPASTFSDGGPLQSSRSPARAGPGMPHKIMNAASTIRRANGIDMTGGSLSEDAPAQDDRAGGEAVQPGRTDCHNRLACRPPESDGRAALHPTETSVKWSGCQGL